MMFPVLDWVQAFGLRRAPETGHRSRMGRPSSSRLPANCCLWGQWSAHVIPLPSHYLFIFARNPKKTLREMFLINENRKNPCSSTQAHRPCAKPL